MIQHLNCWEFMGCGCEPDGNSIPEYGICPAALPGEYTGTNKGTNQGRICWAVKGTLCAKRYSGQDTEKLLHCVHCEFLKHVHEREGGNFALIPH